MVAFAGEKMPVSRDEIIGPVACAPGEDGKGACQRGADSAERFSKFYDGVAPGEHGTVAFAEDDHGAPAFLGVIPQVELCGEDTLEWGELESSLRVELVDAAHGLAAECAIPIEK